MDQPGNPMINSSGQDAHTFHAIVIGSGISGGWAAKELCERGLKTLVLERGRDVQHIRDYPTANLAPWEFPGRLMQKRSDREEDPIQSLVYNEGSKHFFVRDKEHPYVQQQPFNWIRGYQVGGRSLVWGRQCNRMSDLDFNANREDGHGVDWPIRYSDIAPWYDYVEEFIGISGRSEGLKQLPDGKYLPEMPFNCIEEHFADVVKKHFPGRLVTPSRVANLSKGWKDRGPCMYRNLCDRGCPYGGYFSSNSATLPVAWNTGNLTLRPNSIVFEIIIDEEKGRAKGVRVCDAVSGETTDYFADVIFLNASTIASAAILLQSKSGRFPNGIGNNHDMVGRNLMDHHSGAGATGDHEGYQEKYYFGRKPAGIYVPRFQNLDNNSRVGDFVRGYNFQGDGERKEWADKMHTSNSFGKAFKEHLTTPGPWSIWMAAWGECLPNPNNRVQLHKQLKDKWGLPQVVIDFRYGENESAMRKHARQTAAEMLDRAGFKQIETFDYNFVGGTTVHEMGTARMGHDPKTSVLNKFNQVHDCLNLFITDGSCMTSGGCQSPSLTYMALTARAAAYAVDALKSGKL